MTETNVQQAETLSIEELSKKVQEATQELNQLKNGLNGLSLQEKSDRLAELESSILDCSESLTELEADSEISIDKNELESLRSKINTLESDKELLKQQIEAQTKAEIQVLNQSVAQQETKPEGGEPQDKTKKGRFGRQREGLTTRQGWKEYPGRNILWTLGGVGIVAGVCSLFKRHDYESEIPGYSEMSRKEKRLARRKLRKEKRAERRENRPWRQKFLIGAGIATGTVVGGVEVYKHWNKISAWFKEKLGLALSFEEAKQKVEDEVRNGKNDADHFGAFNSNFENGITFNEETQEICSYDQKTKIDKKNKKLEGLDVSFASYEELIHAANIVNFAKRKLRGRGATARPFGQTERGGDISFNCSASGKQEFLSANNSNEWSWILGTIGVAGGGILGGYCAGVKGAAIGGLAGGAGGYALGAYIDNTSAAGRCCSTISRGKNFDLFILYLNDQKDENGKSLWESVGEQHIDSNGSPISGLADNGEKEDITKREGVLAEIEKEYGEDQSGRRNFNILRNKNNPNEYTIQSYGQKAKLIIAGGYEDETQQIDYSKITKIHIEKYDEKDWGDGLDINFPNTQEGIKESIRVCNLTNMIREDRGKKGGDDYPFYWGRYSTPPCLDMDTSGFRGKTILSRDGAKKTPTLFKDLQKGSTGGLSAAVGYTKDYQTKMQNNAINDTTEGSQYIKFLHQMGQGKYWKDPRARY